MLLESNMMPSFHQLASTEYNRNDTSGIQPQSSSPASVSASTDTTPRTRQDSSNINAETESHELCDDHRSAMETDLRINNTRATTMQMQSNSSRGRSPNHLGVITLTILVFYNVSGGPFGVESAVRAGGNRMALLGFLLGPLIWSLQEVSLQFIGFGCLNWMYARF